MFTKNFIIGFIVIFSINISGQSTTIDSKTVSIGDTFETVFDMFNTNDFTLLIDTTNTAISMAILRNDHDETMELVAYLRFEYFSYAKDIEYDKKLFEIERVWMHTGDNDIYTFINTLNNLLELHKIDNYNSQIFQNFSYNPDYTRKEISLQIAPNVYIEIRLQNNNYYEIVEIITEYKYQFSKAEFILIFEDYKKYYSDNVYIIEFFQSEEEALKRKRTLLIRYITENIEKPEVKIVKFHKPPFTLKKSK